MTTSHIGSRLVDLGKIESIDKDTVLLCHFDITDKDVLQGISPLSSVVTLRSDGYFGGAVAIEEATVNLLANSKFSAYSNVAYGWDSVKNGTVAPGSWSTFNGGVVSANIGYHAHLNTSRFDVPVIEYIDRNGQFGSSLKHRWLGISQQFAANVSSLGWTNGTKVSISFDLMVDHIDKGIEYGIYHRNNTNTTSFFGSNYASKYLDKPFEWKRVESTFTLTDSEWDFTGFAAIYIYGHASRNDYEGSAWIKNIQIETKELSTSHIADSRATGILKYDKSVIPTQEGTISFRLYAKMTSNSANPIFSSGVDSDKGTFDLLLGDTSYLRVYGETGDTQLLPEIPKGRWSHITVTWKRSQYLRIYIDGVLNKESINPVDWSSSFQTYSSGFYLGSGIRYNPNILIDELRIDRIARTPEEILSWYLSNSPFYPKGVYRIAY
ncbi:hypothetical protein D3C71_1249790 [compost metagenome]